MTIDNNIMDGCYESPCLSPPPCLQAGSRCTVVNGMAVCLCYQNFWGKSCGVLCAKVCPPSKNLKCVANHNKPATENAVMCACKDDGYIPSDKNDISQGCRKDPCLPSPCRNGVCKNYYGKATCECSIGYWHKYCDVPCDAVCPAHLNLICVKDSSKWDDENAVTCECKNSHYPRDQNDISRGCQKDPCIGSQCVYGMCRNYHGKATCLCTSGYWSKYCNVACDTACPSWLNLICVKDSSAWDSENAVKCACKDNYENINPIDIMEGCYK